jgi:hypothetical protein
MLRLVWTGFVGSQNEDSDSALDGLCQGLWPATDGSVVIYPGARVQFADLRRAMEEQANSGAPIHLKIAPIHLKIECDLATLDVELMRSYFSGWAAASTARLSNSIPLHTRASCASCNDVHGYI